MENAMNDGEMKSVVEKFFKAWEGGSVARVREAYDDYLSDDCVHENSGLAPIVGKEAILNFVDVAANAIGVSTMRVEARAWGFGPNMVFSERIDYHRDTNGHLTLAPSILGVMVFDGEGKITRWSDYYDPTRMLAYFDGKFALAHEPDSKSSA